MKLSFTDAEETICRNITLKSLEIKELAISLKLSLIERNVIDAECTDEDFRSNEILMEVLKEKLAFGLTSEINVANRGLGFLSEYELYKRLPSTFSKIRSITGDEIELLKKNRKKIMDFLNTTRDNVIKMMELYKPPEPDTPVKEITKEEVNEELESKMNSITPNKYNSFETDDYSTGKETWKMILSVVPRDFVIWDPAYYNGDSGVIWREFGYQIIHEDKDFFDDASIPERYDIIVTNPPYSKGLKFKWIQRCLLLGKPFIMLIPQEVQVASYFLGLDVVSKFQYIVPDPKLVAFYKDGVKFGGPRSMPYFFCYDLNLYTTYLLYNDETGKLIEMPNRNATTAVPVDATLSVPVRARRVNNIITATNVEVVDESDDDEVNEEEEEDDEEYEIDLNNRMTNNLYIGSQEEGSTDESTCSTGLKLSKAQRKKINNAIQTLEKFFPEIGKHGIVLKKLGDSKLVSRDVDDEEQESLFTNVVEIDLE